jgi:hypothetical protein
MEYRANQEIEYYSLIKSSDTDRNPVASRTLLPTDTWRCNASITHRSDELLAFYFFEMCNVCLIVVVL